MYPNARTYFPVLLGFLLATGVVAQPAGQPSYLVQVGVADSLYSDVLAEQRDFWVHLPNGGDLQEGHAYPVIYLLDGGVHLAALAAIQDYYTYFRMPEMIVVGISNRENRTRDLTTSQVDTRRGTAVEASGGAERFTRFLEEELMPHIDQTYPTSPHRTLIGHSYGGLFAIRTMIHRRELFTNYIAIDPSMDWDQQAMLHEATAALETEDFSGTGLYVSLANEIIRFSDTMTIDEVVRDTTEFSLGVRSRLAFARAAEAAGARGLRFSWGFYEKDLHGTVPLISMRDGLLFLYDWWELKRPSRYNDPSTPTAELVEMIRERNATLTANMGYPLAMEEDLLTMLGMMAMDMEQPDKAGAVFAILLEAYPESADAHATVADYFEALGDIPTALRHAQRAFSISGREADGARVRSLTDRL